MNFRVILGCLVTSVCVVALLQTRAFAQRQLVLRYDRPATDWQSEALPIGNGRLGAMVFGGVPTERIALNEDTLWSGEPKDWDNPDAKQWLPKVRKALFDGDFAQADELCRKMQGPYNQSYQPLGDLWIDFQHDDDVRDYQRRLDLDNGVATVDYRVGDATYSRTVFVSHPDQALVVRLTCNQPGRLNCDVRINSQLKHAVRAAGAGQLELSGKCPAHVDPNYLGKTANPIIYAENPQGKGMTFAARLAVAADGGDVTVAENRLEVRGANSATILLTAATSFNGPDKSPSREGRDPVPRAAEEMKTALDKKYARLLEEHRQDVRLMMDRVRLDLDADPDVAALPIDQRIKRHREGGADNHLEMLLFQYGRYLLVASSRPGTQPIHLQGIWNDKIRPPWSDNYTMNINVQMSYWPVEVCNLSECHEPLFRLLAECERPGQKSAQLFYGCNGWLTHHNVDLWRQTAPCGNYGHGRPQWANWPMGGAWTCQHLMEHYRFTGDKDFLRDRAYPLMRGAAEFCLDWLIEDDDGRLVTAPSTSPENVFYWPEGKQSCAVSIASTMDMSLIWNLFSDCIDASEELGMDEAFRERLRAARKKLYPLKVGKHGQLQEWFRDWDRPEDHHRHMSHLVGFYPGRQILYHQHPDLTKAVGRSLEMREDGRNVGWSAAWKICLGARLHDAQFCHEIIRQKFRRNVYPNLLGCCPPMIMDSNFGYTAGVAEMLLQSHAGEIELLPALPAVWRNGEIRGLRARGGFEVAIRWREARLEHAEIRSLLGQPLKIRYGDAVQTIATTRGQTVQITGDDMQ